jgi:hypothetical protein
MAYTNIDFPTDYFNTKLTTGTGSTQAVTGLGFQPDFLWGKRRDSTGNNTIFDVVRGITKGLETNNGGAEFTSTDYYDSFDSDGFTIASGSGGCGNGSGQTAVQWLWKANGSGSANTDGDVTSTVSVNTTSGFSIVKWDSTGTAGINIGHGLGQKPAMIIAKCLNQSSTSWPVYHQSLGATKYVSLQATTAETTSATRWNNSEPTTITFQTGSSGDIGGSDRTMIAYCFAEKSGYSSMGKYTGNGSTDGTFVYTGFRPAFVMFKSTSTTGGWEIHDNKRDTFNPSSKRLFPHLSNAEATEDYVDFVSNGFKFRTTDATGNTSGTSYIYMAFAENPFVTSSGVCATAR